jgi:hypothetical protein
MTTRAEVDGAFLAKHDALTETFYWAKRGGQITPALQALFDKAHGYLSLVHMKELIASGIEQDYYADEARLRLRSQEIDEALGGPFRLSPEEIVKVKDTWGLAL